jgi:hypothetical protein
VPTFGAGLGECAENEWAIRGADAIVMDAEIHWCCRRRSVDSDNAWAMLKSLP